MSLIGAESLSVLFIFRRLLLREIVAFSFDKNLQRRVYCRYDNNGEQIGVRGMGFSPCLVRACRRTNKARPFVGVVLGKGKKGYARKEPPANQVGIFVV